jgi:hypothetical protein
MMALGSEFGVKEKAGLCSGWDNDWQECMESRPKFKQLRFLVKLFWDVLSRYQGNCKGVGRSVPIVTSAVPISPVQLISMNSRGGGGNKRGPRGAQYCPVLLISSFSVHSIKLFAASSGVTAISHH